MVNSRQQSFLSEFALPPILWQFVPLIFDPELSIVNEDEQQILPEQHDSPSYPVIVCGSTPVIVTLLIPFFLAHFSVTATVETEPSPYPGDSLDDVAIWVNHQDPGASLILATLKASNVRPVLPTGILVYNLSGQQVQFLKGGTPNNIDLRENFKVAGKARTLIAASHWYSNKVALYLIDKTSLKLQLINDLLPTTLDKVRGLCMYHDRKEDLFYYFVSNELGQMHQYLIDPSLQKAELVRSFSLQTAIEGCVVDDQAETLYIAEESLGIWRLSADPDRAPDKTLVDKIRLFGPLKPDIEGLTLVYETASTGYLIASSQGRSKYVVYNKSTGEFLRSFSIDDSQNIDKVSGSDGITGLKASLGDRFPNGLFVAHDNVNTRLGQRLNQNLKIVPWEKISWKLDPGRREN